MVKRSLIEYQVTGMTGTPPPLGIFTLPINYANRDSRVNRSINLSFEVGSNQALASMTEAIYDINSDLSYFAHLNPKQIKKYHYLTLDLNTAQTASLQTIAGYFANTTPASISEMDYLYNSNYKQRGLINLPTQSRLLNPTNPNEALAKSEAVYDELSQYYSMVDYGSTTGYEALLGANANLRGNPTTKRTWNKDANTWLETHTQFDNFGNVRKVWDITGDQNRYIETDYDPLYKYAYATKVKAASPDPSGVHGMAEGSEITKTFDLKTGLLLSVTDADGQTATTEYDNLLRPVRVNPPAGGSISETVYNDDVNNLWVKVRRQIDVNIWAEQTTFYDKLARPYKTQTKDLQGDVYTEVKYDSLGRVEKTSSPYRQGEQKFWSKPRYDELNRVVESYAPAPDGQQGASIGKVDFGISAVPNFIGPYVAATDASGRKSRTISNIYGIIRIDEAINIGGTTDNDLGTLQNPYQPTFYNYNIKGELTKITQGNPNQSGQPVQNRYFMYDSLGRLIRVRQPEQDPNPNLTTTGNPENNQWTAGYTYDVSGNVTKVTDAKGINIINEYDKAGRSTTRCYTKPDIQATAILCSQLPSSQISIDTPQVDFYYDGKGLPQVPQFSRGALTKVSSSVSETRYTSFDNLGRLLSSEQRTPASDSETIATATPRVFSYKYNLSGGLVEETYPSLRVVKNFLDTDGGLATVSSKAANGQFKTLASNFDYSAAGDVKKMMLGNGRWETTQFNERFQLTQIGLGNSPTDTSLWKVDYEYGELSADGATVETVKNVGNIARQTTTIPTTSFVQTYKYDALDRLVEAKETTNGVQNWKQTFGYDRFGNRTNFSQTIGSTQLQLNNINHPSIDPNTNRFTTGQGYVYDYNGNLIQDAEGRAFTFNGDDKQIEVRDVNAPANAPPIGKYYYDGSGARVKKVTNLETTVFVYDGGGKLAAEYSTAEPPAIPTTSYLTSDHLGSPRVITDKSGNVIARRDFMPFGEEIGVGIGGRTESLKYSFTGTDNVRKRFTGYEKDGETQLDFAEARMYQNKHGRFTAVDPLMASASLLNPQTFNRYTYTGNNPVNYSDPSGLKWVQDANGETYWVPDNEPLNGRTDVTGTNLTVVEGGCLPVAGCVSTGDVVTLNANRSITFISRADGGYIVNSEGAVDAAAELIEATASELGDIISFRPAPSAPAPTIDIPTGGPGGGPLVPGGSDTPTGTDSGTNTGGDSAGSSDDWKVTAAKIAYFLAMYKIDNFLNGDDSPDDAGNYVYRSLAATDYPEFGLVARNPHATNDAVSHSAGKRDSQWISTTRSEAVAKELNARSDGGYGIIRINLSKIDSEVVDHSNGIPGHNPNWQISRWAKKQQEVLIRAYVPTNAIKSYP